ncbi:MAG: hypothetical protein WAK60_03130 [Sedimentisphaerales bacterium]
MKSVVNFPSRLSAFVAENQSKITNYAKQTQTNPILSAEASAKADAPLTLFRPLYENFTSIFHNFSLPVLPILPILTPLFFL